MLGVAVRENLGLPDANIVNDLSAREKLVGAIRRLRPRVVIAPALEGRHPDHIAAAQLVRDASFLAGLKNFAPGGEKHRPLKVLHCLAYRQDFVRPSFVVDISDEFEQKLEAIRCYASQFEGATQAGEVYPNGEPLEDVVRHHADDYYDVVVLRERRSIVAQILRKDFCSSVTVGKTAAVRIEHYGALFPSARPGVQIFRNRQSSLAGAGFQDFGQPGSGGWMDWSP